MENVREAFDAIADRYDTQRKYVIPRMEDFYEAAVWAAAAWPGSSPAILDIGAGTGLLSALLLEKYPRATLTLIDISEKMLEVARKRFAGNPRVRFVAADYSREELPGTYDLVCSALSIHHLDHEDKRRLFSRIYRTLNAGGIFVNADQADAQSTWMRRMNTGSWDAFVSKSPAPPEELRAAMVRRDTLDKNATLLDQISWLTDAGFSGVDIVYKNRVFCVFVGRREEETCGPAP